MPAFSDCWHFYFSSKYFYVFGFVIHPKACCLPHFYVLLLGFLLRLRCQFEAKDMSFFYHYTHCTVSHICRSKHKP